MTGQTPLRTPLRPPLRPSVDDLSPAGEVAVLARALWRDGYDDHHAGHLTYRQPDDTLLTLPMGLGWNEVTAADVVRITAAGDLLEGDVPPPPALRLHLEYHRVHPQAMVTIHQHPRHATVWSAAGRVPPAQDQFSAVVPDEHIVFYDDYRGGVEELEAARHAVAAIGAAPCAILRNHGVFVVDDTIAQSYTRAVALEWRARQAWMAAAIGATDTVPDIGRASINRIMARHGDTVPLLWDWAVRRELGPPPDVLGRD